MTASTISAQLGLRPQDVAAVLSLLADGNTVPFIARYRKETTGNLDEVAIANIGAANDAWLALEARRSTILETIAAQGQLHPALEAQLRAATDKATLEDLYLPFKKKRKTRADAARELGLGPLAEQIYAQSRQGRPDQHPAEDLAGARDIVAERIAETADVRALVRGLTATHAHVTAKAIKKAVEGQRTAYEMYYEFAEPVARIPSHRYLAVCRGEAEGFLRVHLDIDADRMGQRIGQLTPLNPASPWAGELAAAIADSYKRLLGPSVENEVRNTVRERAEAEAVEVFATNLAHLLLAAPFGRKRVVGIDPGFRSGCKCAAMSETGRFLATTTIYPHTGGKGSDEALIAFIRTHQPEAIAIGNGTAGRETEAFVRAALKAAGLSPLVVSVSEAGASVYSASEVARDEFPDLDLTIRGAISIGRRLQDPLAELVKVEPQALGVGQYQHDITPKLLELRLNQVVERCVNRVGAQLDTASAALLQHVAGIGPTLAKRIVAHRDEQGAFTSREQLLKVKGLGPKAYEQAAGFLRIRGAANPLDDSAVHPERYALVRQIARDLGVPVHALVGDPAQVGRIERSRYQAEVGHHTLADILTELSKPGLDPREAFEAPQFREDVNEISDLEVGMVLEGVVTNVAAFGAFVDIGVHQDGLVHVSKLAARYVSDPHAVVSVGQRLQVRVMEVDRERKRISLSVRDV